MKTLQEITRPSVIAHEDHIKILESLFFEGNKYTEAGTILHELVIPTILKQKENINYEKEIEIKTSIKDIQLTAHIDGFIKETNTLLEFKTISTYNFQEYVYNLPKYYLNQIFIYAKAIKPNNIILFLFNRDDLTYKKINYDYKLINSLIDEDNLYNEFKKAEEIYYKLEANEEKIKEYIETEKRKREIEALKQSLNISDLNEQKQIEQLLLNYEQLKIEYETEKEILKQKEKRLDDYEELIKEIFNKHNINEIETSKLIIKYSKTKRNMLDTTKLKNENPTIYQQYLKETTYERLTTKIK